MSNSAANRQHAFTSAPVQFVSFRNGSSSIDPVSWDTEQGPIDKHELLRRLTVTVVEAKRALAKASPENLLEHLHIQAFDVTGLGAVFHSVAHLRGHAQEIVHMTRCQLGDDYEFAFVPTTPEQGA